jgi:hypothetical protein
VADDDEPISAERQAARWRQRAHESYRNQVGSDERRRRCRVAAGRPGRRAMGNGCATGRLGAADRVCGDDEAGRAILLLFPNSSPPAVVAARNSWRNSSDKRRRAATETTEIARPRRPFMSAAAVAVSQLFVGRGTGPARQWGRGGGSACKSTTNWRDSGALHLRPFSGSERAGALSQRDALSLLQRQQRDYRLPTATTGSARLRRPHQIVGALPDSLVLLTSRQWPRAVNCVTVEKVMRACNVQTPEPDDSPPPLLCGCVLV